MNPTPSCRLRHIYELNVGHFPPSLRRSARRVGGSIVVQHHLDVSASHDDVPPLTFRYGPLVVRFRSRDGHGSDSGWQQLTRPLSERLTTLIGRTPETIDPVIRHQVVDVKGQFCLDLRQHFALKPPWPLRNDLEIGKLRVDFAFASRPHE